MRKTKVFVRRIVPAAVALGLVIGGSIPTALAASATEADRRSLSDYIAKADPICEVARTNMAAALAEYEIYVANSTQLRGSKPKIAKPKEYASFIAENLRYLEEQQVAVKKIKLPTGIYTAQLTTIWKKTDAAIAEIKAKPLDAAYTDPLRPLAKELRGLGFASCLQASRPKV
jgi:hypothetical protein